MKLMNRSMSLQCGVNKRSVQGAVAVEMALLLALMLGINPATKVVKMPNTTPNI